MNGAPTHQGNPPAIKPSPRAGVVFKIDDDTVLRGGYGMFWAPWNYSAVTSTGYSQTTSLTQNNNVPITTIDNPFPNGLLQPTGNSLGLASGASQPSASSIPTAPRRACSSVRRICSASCGAT